MLSDIQEKDEDDKKYVLRKQVILILFLNLVHRFLVMYLQTMEIKMLIMYLQVAAYIVVLQVMYRIFYKKASMLVVNNMCMLLAAGSSCSAVWTLRKRRNSFSSWWREPLFPCWYRLFSEGETSEGPGHGCTEFWALFSVLLLQSSLKKLKAPWMIGRISFQLSSELSRGKCDNGLYFSLRGLRGEIPILPKSCNGKTVVAGILIEILRSLTWKQLCRFFMTDTC